MSLGSIGEAQYNYAQGFVAGEKATIEKVAERLDLKFEDSDDAAMRYELVMMTINYLMATIQSRPMSKLRAANWRMDTLREWVEAEREEKA